MSDKELMIEVMRRVDAPFNISYVQMTEMQMLSSKRGLGGKMDGLEMPRKIDLAQEWG